METQIVDLVKANAPMVLQYILMGMGTMVIVGRAYIASTPTQDDDHWLQSLEAKPVIGHVLRFIAYFSPVDRKNKV